jgi:hypothetical protein
MVALPINQPEDVHLFTKTLNFSLISAGFHFSENLPAASLPDGDARGRVMTEVEIQQVERHNTINALIR